MKIFRTWTFRWWEMGILKLGLICLGVILGLYFKSYLAQMLWLWWAIFAVSAAYFIGKLVQESESVNSKVLSEAKPVEAVTKSETVEPPEKPEQGTSV